MIWNNKEVLKDLKQVESVITVDSHLTIDDLFAILIFPDRAKDKGLDFSIEKVKP